MNTETNVSAEIISTLKGLDTFEFPPPWTVFTGGPSSGKTTLANMLQDEFLVVPEVARRIKEETRLVPDLQSDPLSINQRIIRKKIYNEANLDKEKPTLFDRGIPDSLAYLEIHGLKLQTTDFPNLRGRYRNVLLFKSVGFEEDGIRSVSDRDFAEHIEMRIYELYKELDYPVTYIPKLPVNDRLCFVRTFLSKNTHAKPFKDI